MAGVAQVIHKARPAELAQKKPVGPDRERSALQRGETDFIGCVRSSVDM